MFISLFAGRGPDGSGNITPVQADYDSFFLTQTEGDARYAATGSGVTSFNSRTGSVTPQQSDYDSYFLTQTEGDARYLQSVPSEYLTQTEAEDQGMPVVGSVSYSSGSTPSSAVSHGTGNITLRTPTTAKDYWQARLNTSGSQITVSAPTNYTISGTATVEAGQSALFVKVSGSSVFLRWGG